MTDLRDPTYLNFLFTYPSKYARLLEGASRLTGTDRYRQYGELDVQLSRDLAPAVPVGVANAPTFVSSRTGCIVLNPFLDLTAVCLK